MPVSSLGLRPLRFLADPERLLLHVQTTERHVGFLVVLGWSRQFPPINASSRIGHLDVVQGLLEGVPLVSLFLVLEDGVQALRERVLVDVELVVQFRIRVARHSLICLKSIDD